MTEQLEGKIYRLKTRVRGALIRAEAIFEERSQRQRREHSQCRFDDTEFVNKMHRPEEQRERLHGFHDVEKKADPVFQRRLIVANGGEEPADAVVLRQDNGSSRDLQEECAGRLRMEAIHHGGFRGFGGFRVTPSLEFVPFELCRVRVFVSPSASVSLVSSSLAVTRHDLNSTDYYYCYY